MKKLQLILSTIFMALTSLTAYGQNPGNLFTVGNLQYKTTSATKVEVVDYIGTTTEVTIPSTVQYQVVNYTVTAIGKDAFREKGLTSVTIPNTVTSIKSHAFAYNELTGAMTLPNSLTSMESSAFAVNRLTSVTIPPNSVTHIPNYAFHRNQLESVTIPPDVTSIGTHAFQFNRLTEVTLPNNLTSIGNSAFWDNDLTEVTLPVNVTRIDQWAFWDNPNLVTVRAKSTNNPLPTLDKDAFKNRGQIHLVVPRGKKDVYLSSDWTDFKSITEVAKVNDTFIAGHITYKITKIVPDKEVKATDYSVTGGAVTIPPTVDHGPNTYMVTSIGGYAFQNNQLTEVIIPNSVTSIGEGAFSTNQLIEVTIPNSVTSIGIAAFVNNDLTEITIPNSVTSIGEHAFQNNELTGVTIPNSVTNIGFLAFSVNQLTEVIIPDSVTNISYGAFWNNRLTEVIIPNSVTSIRKDAFGNNRLTEVIIPNSVTSIGRNAFGENPNLGLVTMKANDPPALHPDAFQNPGRDQIDVVVPKGKRQVYLENNYWTDFRSITEVVKVDDTFIADNITYKITKIVPDKEVAVIGYNTSGGEVIIPPTVDHVPNTNTYTVTSIGESAFFGKQLTKLTFSGESNVTRIGQDAFGNNRLTEVIIPNSVTSIGRNAFGENPNLGLVTVKANDPPALHPDAFQNPNRDQIDVVVPKGTRQVYLGNNEWTDFRSITEVVKVDDTFSVDNITYKITKIVPDKEVAVIGYNTSGGEVIIPPTVDHVPNTNTYTVTAIGQRAFFNKQLTKLTFSGESNVTRIGQDAFWGVNALNQLGSVIIPNSVTHLEQRAFGTCGLTSVKIPENITRLEKWVFAENDLREVTIPASVESIEYQAFYNNPNLGLVTVKANDPPALDANAFQGMHSDLRHQIDLVVPKDKRQDYLDHNEWTVFRSITEVVERGDTFTVDQIIYKVTSLNPYKVEAENYIIGGDTALIIPPTVDHGLNTYTVTSIGEFSGFWPYLVSLVRVEADNPPMLPPTSFPGRSEVDVIVPEGTKEAYLAAGWTDFRSITEPYDVGNTFTDGNYTYLITSSNPQTVKAIDYTGTATYVNIPGIVNTVKGLFTVTAIGNEVFKEKGLTSVAIPNSVTSIGDHAFSGNQLTEVTLPNSLTSIGDHAFWDNDLTEVTIPNNVDSIGEAAFSGNKLARVTIGNNVTSIGEGAFVLNSDLVIVVTKATTPPTLHGNHVFDRLTDKIDLIVPAGTKQAYQAAGWGGHYFVNIDTDPPYGFTFDNIYYKVTSLTPYEVEVAPYNNITGGAVTIPPTVDYFGLIFGLNTYTVTAIAGRAFYNQGLTSVTIPNSVTSIEEGAFENNPNLETVTVKATNPPSLHLDAFQNADRNQIDLIVPIGKRQKYLDNGWHGFRSTTEAAIAATQSSSAWGASTVSEVAPAHSNKGNELENFKVYPNPVQDRIHIRLSDGEALQQVNIYNTQGVHVYSANTLQIDISHLSGGMYMLEIETKAGKRVVKRVIVK